MISTEHRFLNKGGLKESSKRGNKTFKALRSEVLKIRKGKLGNGVKQPVIYVRKATPQMKEKGRLETGRRGRHENILQSSDRGI